MKKPHWQHDSLQTGVHRLEDGIITLSGPALAISGIIAGVDLLTGGHMLQSVGWLSVTWAICLLLTLDFQVLTLGVKAQAVYQSKEKNGWQKFGELLLLLVVAAAISYVSIQMQSIIARSSGANVSINQASLDLGVNPIALIWERSILVLLLIFLSGWSRDRGSVTPVTLGSGKGQWDDLVATILDALTRSNQEMLTQVMNRVRDESDAATTRLADQVSRDNQDILGTFLDQLQNEHQAVLAECIKQLEQAHARRFEAVLTRVQQVQITLEDVAQNTAQFPVIKPGNQLRLTPGRGQAAGVTTGAIEASVGSQSQGLVTPQAETRAGSGEGQHTGVSDPALGSGAPGSGEGQVTGKGVAVQMFIASYLAATGSLPGVKTVVSEVPCARNTARFYLRQAGASEQ